MLRRTLTRPAHLKPSQCSFLRLPGRSAVSGICSRSSRRTHIVSAYTASTSSSVKIVIHGRKLPVTDAIRQYIDSKIQRAVHNFAHTVKEIDVTVSARGGDTGTKGPREQKVDVTIHTLRNGVVRVEDAESDLYASIDLVCDKVERKLRKLKERSIANGTWHGRAGPHIDVDGEAFKEYLQEVIYETRVSEEIEKQHELEVLSSDFPATIVRSKVLPLQPMAVEEAVEQLEQLGHDFFVFLEKQSGTVQVLYKRRMEGYGLLIPKTQSA